MNVINEIWARQQHFILFYVYSAVYYILWHPLSIMSFTSGISNDTVSFDEITVFLIFITESRFSMSQHNNQAVISKQCRTGDNVFHQEYRCPTYMAIISILKWMSSVCDKDAIFLTRAIPRLDQCSRHDLTRYSHMGMPSIYGYNYSNTVY